MSFVERETCSPRLGFVVAVADSDSDPLLSFQTPKLIRNPATRKTPPQTISPILSPVPPHPPSPPRMRFLRTGFAPESSSSVASSEPDQ
jgi:hypothetical protein